MVQMIDFRIIDTVLYQQN